MVWFGKFNIFGEMLDDMDRPYRDSGYGVSSSDALLEKMGNRLEYFSVERKDDIITITFANGVAIPLRVSGFDLCIYDEVICSFSQDYIISIQQITQLTDSYVDFIMTGRSSVRLFRYRDGTLEIVDKGSISSGDMRRWLVKCDVKAKTRVTVTGNGDYTQGNCTFKRRGGFYLFGLPNGYTFPLEFKLGCPVCILGIETELKADWIHGVVLDVVEVRRSTCICRLSFMTTCGSYTSHDIICTPEYIEYHGKRVSSHKITKLLMVV